MLKHDEIEDKSSCFNKAADRERLFVLLARDPAAPVAIRAWIAERIRLGKNKPEDSQVREAEECASRMEVERAEIASARRQQTIDWTDMNVTISRFASTRVDSSAREELSWRDFVGLFAEPIAASCTLGSCFRSSCTYKHVACWSPAVYAEGARRRDGAAAVSLLVFDVQHAADAQIYEIRGRIDSYRHLIHSTHSDRPGSRCVRIIIALSRPVPRAAWGAFWRVAQQTIAPIADPACADAGRIYFMPSMPRDAGYFIQVNGGAPLDVDATLVIAAAVRGPDHAASAAEGEASP